MQIELLKSLNSNLYNLKTGFETKNNHLKNRNISEIQSKSLSEAIGRSQVVSFKGKDDKTGPIVIKEYNRGILKKRTKDIFEYNKSDGSYIHTVLGSNGELLKKEEYYPKQSKEIFTSVDLKTGVTKTTTKYPDVKYIEKENSDGMQIYYSEMHSNGNGEVVETDFKNHRQIITVIKNGLYYVSVINLLTGEYVTDGDLVLKTKFDPETNQYVTYNVINGNIYKIRKEKPNGKLDCETEYYKDTSVIKRRCRYNEKTGGYNETFYDINGVKSAFVSGAKNNRVFHRYEFQSDGKTVKLHVKQEYNKSGQLTFLRIYNPSTNKIFKEFQYGKDSQSCITFFKESPNVPEKTEFYIGNTLDKYVYYQEDGETFKSLTELTKDGGVKNTYYNENGKKLFSELFSKNKQLKQKIEYNINNGKPSKIIEFDNYTGNRTEYLFDIKYNKVFETNKYDKNGELIQSCYYNEDSDTVRIQVDYFADGSSRYTYYDEYGKKINHVDYNADGTQKDTSSYEDYQRNRRAERPHYSTNSSTSSAQHASYSHNKSNVKNPKKEAIQRILKELSSKHPNLSSISDDDWNILSEITEIDDINELKNMSSDTYRKIAKKFHPDANINDKELQEEREPIFIICKALYERTK